VTLAAHNRADADVVAGAVVVARPACHDLAAGTPSPPSEVSHADVIACAEAIPKQTYADCVDRLVNARKKR
jgi:hypothetical protein